MNHNQKTSFHDGNRFYILGSFTDELNETIVVPLRREIDTRSRTFDAEIEIYINSNGGRADICLHLVALVELAKSRGITVKTIVPYNAYSAGSMLAITGSKGYRYIAQTAEHLIHYGTFDGYTKTTPIQIERTADFYKRWNKTLIGHYKKYSNVPKIEEHIKDDNFWIPAKDCIKWSLADKYMDEL